MGVIQSPRTMMLFSLSRFQHRPSPEPFVLALSSDVELSEIRIRPFLTALLARGIIAGFQFADRKMNSMGWHKDFSFTHIWCHRNVSTAQYRFLRRNVHVPMIYDIDDLMIAPPDFVKSRPRIEARIRWCLDHAQSVTTSTEVLRKHLLRQVASSKPVITLKNGYAGSVTPYLFPTTPQKKVVWTSGDHPFVTRDHPQFTTRLADIVNRHGYEIIMIGRFDPAMGKLFKRSRYIQRLDFNSYREMLRYFAGAIGLAPLPSGLSPHNQQFFDAKSDIKLLDYLSSGLVPVCTSTPPYTQSELYIPELAAESPDGLLDRLENCLAGHAAWMERIARKFQGAGIIEQRQFGPLSQNLDTIFPDRSVRAG